jgi:hypothetical protein
MHMPIHCEKSWLKLARRTALKLNLGWLAEAAGPGFVIAGLVTFAVLLGSRTIGQLPYSGWIALTAACVLGLALGIPLLGTKRRWIRPREAMVLLEAELSLNNALTAALHGCRNWPAFPSRADDGLRWDWQRLFGPPNFMLACVAAGLLLPVAEEGGSTPPGQPQAWQQVEDWLKELREEQVADDESIREREEQFEALKQRPQEQWFNHESLNAADELREQMRRDIRDLARNLADASRSLNALGQEEANLGQAGREQMQQEFSQALEQMRSGGLKPDARLLEELSKIDPKNLKGMSQEQLKQLRSSMQSKCEKCESMTQGFGRGKGFLGDGEGEDDALADGRGAKDKMPTGPDGDGAGSGGIARGPGTAPLTLADEEDDFGTDKMEALQQRDFSKAQPGTLLGVRDGKHEVDQASHGPTEAGAVRDLGQGGGQVWREQLSPEEKAVLKQVFR